MSNLIIKDNNNSISYNPKYIILFISKENTEQFRILKYDKDIENKLYNNSLFDAIQTTLDINEAYKFDSIEKAKDLAYKLKYHYRELLNISIGIKQI